MLSNLMGVRKISLVDARVSMSNKEPSDHIVYRNMALFISSCWFYLTTCVFFLIKFIARHAFRYEEFKGNSGYIGFLNMSDVNKF